MGKADKRKQRYTIVHETLRIPMRDGVTLSVSIDRPKSDRRFPCLLTYMPYRKSSGLGREFAYFAEYGYAIAVFDVRGTGDSSGYSESPYSEEERQDGYDMVEWCAAQPWCDGNVGMWGISYGAVVSLQIAQLAPPHLKAIIARSGTDDPYTEWTNPGGSPRIYIYELYAPFMTARNFAPPDPQEWGDQWEQVWRERLERSVPWGITFLENLKDGPFWRARSLRGNFDKVECAVFVVGGWADWYPTPLLNVFCNLQVPKRALIGPWSHQWPHEAVPGPRIDWDHEALRWWDHWLKGIDTGIMNEPPLTIFVREYSKPRSLIHTENGSFRCENEWPIARANNESLLLAPRASLSQAPPATTGDSEAFDTLDSDPSAGAFGGKQGGGPFRYNCLRPLDQRGDELKSLAYTGDVLEEDTIIIGRPSTTLYVSCSEDLGQLVVRLCDVAPDGTSVQITKGVMNLAFREYPEAEPSPLQPGKIYKTDLQMLACAYKVSKGHRVRLAVSTAELLEIWPLPRRFTIKIHRDQEHPSALILPSLGAHDSPYEAPSVKLLSDSGSPELPPVTFVVSTDIVNDVAMYEFENSQLFATRGKFTVALQDPANAEEIATANFSCSLEQGECIVSTVCRTSSDAQAFRHDVQLDISINGEPYLQKSWQKQVPRGLC